MDKVIKQVTVYETTDYGTHGDLENLGKFKLHPENRSIDLGHARALGRKMEREGNMLDLFPIEVTSDFTILDGQHRLIGAREKGYPVCYQIVEGNISTITARNSGTKQWNWVDWTTRYAKGGNKSYQNLLDLHERFPRVQKNIILDYCNISKRKWGLVESGDLVLSDAQHAAAVRGLEMYQDFADIVGRTTMAASAVLRLVRSPGYDHNKMYSLLLSHGDFSRCYTVDDYLIEFDKLLQHN